MAADGDDDVGDDACRGAIGKTDCDGEHDSDDDNDNLIPDLRTQKQPQRSGCGWQGREHHPFWKLMSRRGLSLPFKLSIFQAVSCGMSQGFRQKAEVPNGSRTSRIGGLDGHAEGTLHSSHPYG